MSAKPLCHRPYTCADSSCRCAHKCQGCGKVQDQCDCVARSSEPNFEAEAIREHEEEQFKRRYSRRYGQ